MGERDDAQKGWENFDKALIQIGELSLKLEAIREIAPEILAWMSSGYSWSMSESTRSAEYDKTVGAEFRDLEKQFRELLGLEEESPVDG